MAEQLPGGYTGRILRVDLTTERVWVETLTADECRYYLGAAGIGYKILWEDVHQEVNWDNPDKVSRRDLKQAIDSILSDENITIEQIPSMGCSIKWKTT